MRPSSKPQYLRGFRMPESRSLRPETNTAVGPLLKNYEMEIEELTRTSFSIEFCS